MFPLSKSIKAHPLWIGVGDRVEMFNAKDTVPVEATVTEHIVPACGFKLDGPVEYAAEKFLVSTFDGRSLVVDRILITKVYHKDYFRAPGYYWVIAKFISDTMNGPKEVVCEEPTIARYHETRKGWSMFGEEKLISEDRIVKVLGPVCKGGISSLPKEVLKHYHALRFGRESEKGVLDE